MEKIIVIVGAIALLVVLFSAAAFMLIMFRETYGLVKLFWGLCLAVMAVWVAYNAPAQNGVR